MYTIIAADSAQSNGGDGVGVMLDPLSTHPLKNNTSSDFDWGIVMSIQCISLINFLHFKVTGRLSTSEQYVAGSMFNSECQA